MGSSGMGRDVHSLTLSVQHFLRQRFSPMLFVLLVTILLSSVLISTSCAVAVSRSLLVRPYSSPLLPPVLSVSSANRRLHMDLPPMEMDYVAVMEFFVHELY